MMHRRSFLAGLLAAVAAPVTPAVLEPLKALCIRLPADYLTLDEYSERILRPMIDAMQRQIADQIMNVSNQDGLAALLLSFDSDGGMFNVDPVLDEDYYERY